MIQGYSPYDYGAQSPPWFYIPLIPVALMSPALGSAVIFVLSGCVFAFIAIKMRASKLTFGIFMVTPLIWSNSFNGNLDFLAAIGLILPPQIGLFFVLAKPQIGIGAAVFWLLSAWQKGRFREVARVFFPVGVAFLISFGMYGFWPAKIAATRLNDPFNTSFWPIGLVMGVVLLVSALRRKNFKHSFMSSLFLSPYVNLTSWSIAILGLLDDLPELIAAVVTLWILQLLGLRMIHLPW
jgi:hypothetical protein